MDETMVVFLFNSDNPPESDIGYGALAETVLLKHLFGCWEGVAGKPLSDVDLKACHGDLFETHPLGDDFCTVGILAQMVDDDGIPLDNLSPGFATALSSGELLMGYGPVAETSLGFIPWAVGVSPLATDVAVQVNNRMKGELPDFYLGMVAFPSSAIFEETASRLSLPQDMRIEAGQLAGDWKGKAP